MEQSMERLRLVIHGAFCQPWIASYRVGDVYTAKVARNPSLLQNVAVQCLKKVKTETI